MKNFSKKCGFLAAAAALLAVTVMLVTTGCGNDMGGLGYNDEFTPPPGKGAVRLSFNEKINTRSIFPDELDKNDFTSFDFDFEQGATALPTKTVLIADIDKPIALDPGTYSLTVTAYIGSKAVATGTVTDITIVAAKTTSAKITLKPYDPGVADEDGTFQFNISSSIVSDLSSAKISFSKTSDGSLVETVDLIAGNLIDSTDHDISLPAGYYYLDFVIKAKSGDEVIFREILLISQNMTSTYPSFTIKRDYFYGSLSVEFDYEDTEDIKPLLIDEDDKEYVEGDTITITKGNSIILIVSNVNYFDNIRWYTQGNTALTGATGVKGEVYDVNTGDDTIFSMRKTYQLTIIGIKGGVYYSSYIYIQVN